MHGLLIKAASIYENQIDRRSAQYNYNVHNVPEVHERSQHRFSLSVQLPITEQTVKEAGPRFAKNSFGVVSTCAFVY